MEESQIDLAVKKYNPVRIFALYSSGDDSLVSTHFAMEHGAHEVIHINTGIGVDEGDGLSVKDVVHETCKRHGWPYRIVSPPDLSYEEMVLKYGFPGPGGHLFPYSWLKERALAKVQRETKTHRSQRIGLITGVHRTESARRMGYVQPIVKQKARIWIAPLYNWSKLDFSDYRKQNGLQRSPIAVKLGMSGECLCGGFAQPGELLRIGKMFPRTHQRILDLQDAAKEIGVPCKWGTRPPKRRLDNQHELPFLAMCVNCHST